MRNVARAQVCGNKYVICAANGRLSESFLGASASRAADQWFETTKPLSHGTRWALEESQHFDPPSKPVATNSTEDWEA